MEGVLLDKLAELADKAIERTLPVAASVSQSINSTDFEAQSSVNKLTKQIYNLIAIFKKENNDLIQDFDVDEVAREAIRELGLRLTNTVFITRDSVLKQRTASTLVLGVKLSPFLNPNCRENSKAVSAGGL